MRLVVGLLKRHFRPIQVCWRSPLIWMPAVLMIFFLGTDPVYAMDDLSPRPSTLPFNEQNCTGVMRNLCRGSVTNIDGLSFPDLQTLPPFDFSLVEYRGIGRREIRFANSVWNSGEGVLELHGVYDRADQIAVFYQRLYGEGQREAMYRVGEFTFHPEHNHWHWIDFSVYEIWELAPDGSLGEIVATSGKIGYCMLDIRSANEQEMQASSIDEKVVPDTRQYRGCAWRLQGISVGWVDTYFAYTPGQVMDVTGLRNGIYAFRSTVDPEGYLFEMDEENNSAIVYFSLYGNQIRLIGETLPTTCRPEASTDPSPGNPNHICN